MFKASLHFTQHAASLLLLLRTLICKGKNQGHAHTPTETFFFFKRCTDTERERYTESDTQHTRTHTHTHTHTPQLPFCKKLSRPGACAADAKQEADARLAAPAFAPTSSPAPPACAWPVQPAAASASATHFRYHADPWCANCRCRFHRWRSCWCLRPGRPRPQPLRFLLRLRLPRLLLRFLFFFDARG